MGWACVSSTLARVEHHTVPGGLWTSFPTSSVSSPKQSAWKTRNILSPPVQTDAERIAFHSIVRRLVLKRRDHLHPPSRDRPIAHAGNAPSASLASLSRPALDTKGGNFVWTTISDDSVYRVGRLCGEVWCACRAILPLQLYSTTQLTKTSRAHHQPTSQVADTEYSKRRRFYRRCRGLYNNTLFLPGQSHSYPQNLPPIFSLASCCLF
ncbi:hypothetical protein C8F01DRAFT_12519 [Mycena amicta]|nr:hypothetical protein C8F01DRAFT_12519 [Mycena amicta]